MRLAIVSIIFLGLFSSQAVLFYSSFGDFNHITSSYSSYYSLLLLTSGALFVVLIYYLYRYRKLKHRLIRKILEHTKSLETANYQLKRNLSDLENKKEEQDRIHVQMVQRGKLAALGTLSAGISHELNNPLAIVLGYAEEIDSLLDEGIDEEVLRLCVAKIKKASERMKIIINHMKEFSRDVGSDRRILTNPKELIEGALLLISESLKREDIKLNIEVENNLPSFWVNRLKMETVFHNLISNAKDALGYRNRQEKQININSYYDVKNKNIVFAFKDNGIGISKTDIDKVYDPFFTTKEIGAGKGLGLSMIYGVIKEHEGEITINSKEHIGTEVYICLPVDMRKSRLARQEELRDGVHGN